MEDEEDENDDDEKDEKEVDSVKENDDDGDNDAYEKEDEEDEDEEQPLRKITKKVRHQIREYYFLKTVKSMDELDKFRLKVTKQKLRYLNILKFKLIY
jgi:hypothetical protein